MEFSPPKYKKKTVYFSDILYSIYDIIKSFLIKDHDCVCVCVCVAVCDGSLVVGAGGTEDA